MPGQIEQKYLEKMNRNTCTKTEMPGQKTEILGQKQKCLDKNRNTWTNTEILV